MIAGQTLNIEGKTVKCPSAPLYYIKSFGHVVDIKESRYDAEASFASVVAAYKEIWKMDEKGLFRCIRSVRGGKDD